MPRRPTATQLVAAGALVWALAATMLLMMRPEADPPEAEVDRAVEPPKVEADAETTDRTVLYRSARFEELPGWQTDPLVETHPALIESCRRIGPMPEDAPLSAAIGGKSGNWRGFCDRLSALGAGDGAGLRELIEAELTPVEVIDPTPEDPQSPGLFTGYYEPTLHGSRERTDRFRWPLYRRPRELVELDLGQFRQRLAGETILGHVRDGAFAPYHRRDEIDAGSLAGRGLELVWVDDPVDAFFLHIQGSGRVEIEVGPNKVSVMRVGYDGQNGHAYTAIGRELVKRGAMPLEQVSMQSIRTWLEDHPDQRQHILHTNPSYIFFHELEGPGPIGSLGAPLTPERSMAVDRDVVPLGAPVWLTTTVPGVDGGEQPFRRLMSAQDTGGAIRGAQRGDVFWGPGDDAAEIAGRMKHPGRMWVLVPGPPPSQ